MTILDCCIVYKFGNDQKNFGCVGSCGYAPASVKYREMGEKSHLNVSTSVLSAMSTPVGCAQFIEKVIDEFQVQNLITTHDQMSQSNYAALANSQSWRFQLRGESF